MDIDNIWGFKFPSMKINVKRLHPDAVIPSYAKQGDAGLDITAISKRVTPNYIEYGSGVAVEIPEGYVGLLFPRSSITNATPGVMLKNSIGVIDAGYRGEISVRMNLPTEDWLYDEDCEEFYESNRYEFAEGVVHHPGEVLPTPAKGDRVAQLIILPYPHIELHEVDELSETDRGEGGFGSTNQQ